MSDLHPEVVYLRSPAAIRAEARHIFDRVRSGQGRHFSLDLGAMDQALDLVLKMQARDYPSGDIPYHSRWRHFAAGGIDREAKLQGQLGAHDPKEQARRKIELAIISVLLDAGAGPDYRYRDTEGVYARSEALAVASFAMFQAGLFSSTAKDPWRVDAAALKALSLDKLGQGFQVNAQNPLVGLEGRLALLHRLAQAVEDFAPLPARLGSIYDLILQQQDGGHIAAKAILQVVLARLADIWPGRVSLHGVNLGDCWPHSDLPSHGPGAGLIPFHKLSQWLTYSLCEPIAAAGHPIVDLDALTGLPEYRNGGLFLDLGILRPKSPSLLQKSWLPGDEPIVEWRALTVLLLDELAGAMRRRLGVTAVALPLVKVLQAGTWTAGRAIAAALRPGGAPPITIVSDGTVF